MCCVAVWLCGWWQLASELKWVQLVMAGIDKALSFVDVAQAPYRITRAGGESFGPQSAQHCTAPLEQPTLTGCSLAVAFALHSTAPLTHCVCLFSVACH